jgi:transposase
MKSSRTRCATICNAATPEFDAKMAEVLCVYRDHSYDEKPGIQALATTAPATAIKVILDNHSAHISRETKAWLAEQPEGRFTFVFTPKHGSWFNLVEGFFSKLARSVLRHIRVAPIRLAEAHARFIAGQRRSRKQSRLDLVRLLVENRSIIVENGHQRALADREPEQVAQHDDEAGEGYALDRAEIDDQGAQIVAERRTRREVGWRRGLEVLAAA